MSIIKKLFHVSLQVNDYEGTLKFYRDKLGFGQLFELNLGQFKQMLSMGTPDENDDMPWLTYLRVAPGQYIEMFNGAVGVPDFIRRDVPREEDSPFNYMAFGTDSIARSTGALEKLGISVEDGFFSDPEGSRIKIVQARPPVEPKGEHIFTSLAGLSLFVNDLDNMTEFLKKMHFIENGRTEKTALLGVGEQGQWLELTAADRPIVTRTESLLGHFALGIYSIVDTVKAWGANDLICRYHPHESSGIVPADDTAVGETGMDGCEIIWIVCPEGNKVEVMVEPGDNLQQLWEDKNSF